MVEHGWYIEPSPTVGRYLYESRCMFSISSTDTLHMSDIKKNNKNQVLVEIVTKMLHTKSFFSHIKYEVKI